MTTNKVKDNNITTYNQRKALIEVYGDLVVAIAFLPQGNAKTTLNRILERLEAIVRAGSEDK